MIKNINNEIELSSFYIVFDGSTMNEKSGTYGLSHLLEHLICKSFDHLQDDFQRYGISYNAYTSNNEVVFYMTGLDEYINKYKYEFLELILSYDPTEEELTNEKKIVLEEYKDSFNDQINNHFLNLNRKLFGYYHPIGLRSDIENFTIEDCKEYLELFYKKPTMIINVSKNNDFDFNVDFRESKSFEPFRILDNTKFFKIQNKSDSRRIVPEGVIPLELMNKYKNKESIINVSNVASSDFPTISFTCSMLGSGLNSPLYQEVREKSGLAYYVQCVNQKLNNNSSIVTILTETSTENVDYLQDEIGKVLNNKETYLTQDRFEIIKDNFLVKLKKSNILRHSNVNRYMEPPTWNMENYIDKITLDDVYNVMDKYFKWDGFYTSIYNKEF